MYAEPWKKNVQHSEKKLCMYVEPKKEKSV